MLYPLSYEGLLLPGQLSLPDPFAAAGARMEQPDGRRHPGEWFWGAAKPVVTPCRRGHTT